MSLDDQHVRKVLSSAAGARLARGSPLAGPTSVTVNEYGIVYVCDAAPPDASWCVGAPAAVRCVYLPEDMTRSRATVDANTAARKARLSAVVAPYV